MKRSAWSGDAASGRGARVSKGFFMGPAPRARLYFLLAPLVLLTIPLYLLYSSQLYGVAAAVVPSMLYLAAAAMLYRYSSWRTMATDKLARYAPVIAMAYIAPLAAVGFYRGFGLNTLYISWFNAALSIGYVASWTLALEHYRLAVLRSLRGWRGCLAAVLLTTALTLPLARVAQPWLFLLASMSAAAYSMVLSMIALSGGYRPAVATAMLLQFFLNASPILPDIPVHIGYVASIISCIAAAAITVLVLQDAGALPEPSVWDRARRGMVGAAASITVAAAAVLLVAGLLAGYRFFVVMTGSMEPGLMPGDIVVSYPSNNYSVGDTIVYVYRGSVVVHRIESIEGDGTIYTRGDANDDIDPWFITREDIVGRVVLRVPWAGRPLLILSLFSGGYINGLFLLVSLIGFAYLLYTVYRYVGALL